jgi:hypothetical protein
MIIKIGIMNVLIDDEDYQIYQQYKWHLHKGINTFYLRGYVPLKRKEGLKYFHRLILNPTDKMEVDHINGNGLDNRRSNLRICTKSQNNANRKTVQSKTSGFKGVHFESCTQKWRAEIVCNNIRYRLGRFANKMEAVNAYKQKAVELFGEYAS